MQDVGAGLSTTTTMSTGKFFHTFSIRINTCLVVLSHNLSNVVLHVGLGFYVDFDRSWVIDLVLSFIVDDLELAAQMDALGLPLTFSTSKVCLYS